jgi:hypothetical protein
VAVSYETVRRWVNHFGLMIAADLRKRRLKRCDNAFSAVTMPRSGFRLAAVGQGREEISQLRVACRAISRATLYRPRRPQGNLAAGG